MEYNRMLGEFICYRRKELGLTQKELAAKVGISDKAVSKWETLEANPDISLLVPLSEALQISVEELLRGVKSEEKERKDGGQTELQAERVDGKRRKRGNAVRFALCLVATVILGLIVSFLLICVMTAFTSSEKDKVTLIVVFTVLFLAFSVLFLYAIKKTVQNAVAEAELFTDEKEINGYLIYQNLSKQEKKAVNAKLFGKGEKYGYMAALVVCGLGAVACSILRFFYDSLALSVCGLVVCIVWLALQIVFITVKTKRLWQNKIITSRRQLERLKQGKKV